MERVAQKRFARIALVVFTVLGLAWLSQIDFDQKISTNIVDLIPVDERSPEIALVRSIVGERQARVALFALRSAEQRPASDAAVKSFFNSLQSSGHFSELSMLGDTASRDALGTFVFKQRFQLLFPGWLEQRREEFAKEAGPSPNDAAPDPKFANWLADRVISRMDTFLARPESVAFQELLPADPLILVPELAENAEALGFSRGSDKASLVWAILREAPFVEAGQEPVFAAIAEALEAAKKVESGVTLQWTAINRFAADSRDRIKAEMRWTNALSLIVVIGIAVLFVRKIWNALHLVPVVLLSILGAWVFTTFAFERLHILVFVVGSLLTGVAIDYGFYLYMQPALRPDETYGEKLKRLLKPLLSSCLTTVIGFGFLLFSDLPLIRQLGVFVSAGLLSALIAAVLYFAQLRRPYLEARELPRPDTAAARPIIRIAGITVCLLALWGISRLTWRDDIRDLEVPAPALRANDRLVRDLFGDSENRSAFITRGSTVAEARANLDRFLSWHDQRHPESTGASLAWVVPSQSAVEAASKSGPLLSQFQDRLRATLDERGYTAESFQPFFEAFSRYLSEDLNRPYDSIIDSARQQLTGPLSLLMSVNETGAWFLTLANHAVDAGIPAELATVPVTQLESLNTLFTRYRRSALQQSAIGLSLVGLSVFVLYGLKRGLRIFAIPAGSCLLAFGLLGLMGSPLNLFHLLGAFLGVCLSHNFAIFSAENADRNEAPPPSIRLSALSTAGSFGVLAFSKIPVVAALGTIVALIVLIALLAVELEPLSVRRNPRLGQS